jgi:hypothetical protein
MGKRKIHMGKYEFFIGIFWDNKGVQSVGA